MADGSSDGRPSWATRPGEELYDWEWIKTSRAYLATHPFCAYCERRGVTKGAQVTDHITPHKGDRGLFWDPENWQPLCRDCHNSEKAREEATGRSARVDRHGWPVDSRHHFRKGSPTA